MSQEKQKQKEGIIQGKGVLFYKLYAISSESSRLPMPKPILLKKEINNLEKTLKIL